MRLFPPGIIKICLIASAHQHQGNNLVTLKDDIGAYRKYRLNLIESVRMSVISISNLLMTSRSELANSGARNRYFDIVLQFQFYQKDRFSKTFRHNLHRGQQIG
jgi:hypothetical protein